MSALRACVICGGKFVLKPMGWAAKVCSVRCRRRWAGECQRRRRGTPPMSSRACATCGREFRPRQVTTKTCSARCRHERKIQMDRRYHQERGGKTLGLRACVICGDQFMPRSWTTKTCSARCHRERRTQTTRQYRLNNRERINLYKRNRCAAKRSQPQPEQRACVICGGAFATRQPHTKTCSVECRREKDRQYRLANRERSNRQARQRHVSKLTERQCVICGSGFMPKSGRAKVCSVPCRREQVFRVRRAYRTANAERRRQSLRQWKDANSDWVKEYMRQWREANSDWLKQWALDYRDRNRERIDDRKRELGEQVSFAHALAKLRPGLLPPGMPPRQQRWFVYRLFRDHRPGVLPPPTTHQRKE